MSNSENDEKLDRKSILKSTVPKRKGRIPIGFSTYTESQPNNKFLDLIQYYECLELMKDKPNTKKSAPKEKNAVSFSTSTTPDIAEYESSSTGTRSIATPDLLHPGLPKSTSSIISESESRNESPDLGYTSITKPGFCTSQDYEDNTTSGCDSRNISPEYGYRDISETRSRSNSSDLEYDNNSKMKVSESPDLGFEATPEKQKNYDKNYGNMRYLLDLKVPHFLNSESISGPKSDFENNINKNYPLFESNLASHSDNESNSAQKLPDFEFDTTMNKTSTLKSHVEKPMEDIFLIDPKGQPESFLSNNSGQFSFNTTPKTESFSGSENSEIQNTVKKKSIDDVMHDRNEDTQGKKSLDDSQTFVDRPTSDRSSLSQSTMFEYSVRKNSLDFPRYKITFDVTESETSLCQPLQGDEESESRKSFYMSNNPSRKNLSRSSSDGYQYDEDVLKIVSYQKNRQDNTHVSENLSNDTSSEYHYDMENTTLGNSLDLQYDGIMGTQIEKNSYIAYQYEERKENLHDFIKLEDIDTELTVFNQPFNLQFQNQTDKFSDLEKYIESASKTLNEIFDLKCNDQAQTNSSVCFLGSNYQDHSKTESVDDVFNNKSSIEPDTNLLNNSLKTKHNVQLKSIIGIEENNTINPTSSTYVPSFEPKTLNDIESNTKSDFPLHLPNDLPKITQQKSDGLFDLGINSRPNDLRPETEFSEAEFEFGHVTIPDYYERPTSPQNRPERLRTPYLKLRDSRPKSCSNATDLLENKSDHNPINKCNNVESHSSVKLPFSFEHRFPTSGHRYSLPRPHHFLPEPYHKPDFESKSRNASFNSSSGLFESKNKAMHSFMSSCINQEPGYDVLPESGSSCLPTLQQPHELTENFENSGHHKMKIDLYTVDYIMNHGRRSSIKKDDCSKDLTDDDIGEDHNYSIASLIGALDELGIEVEFNDPDEQHRRRTIGRNTSLMESVREEDETELKEEDHQMDHMYDHSKHHLNEIEEVDEIQSNSEINNQRNSLNQHSDHHSVDHVNKNSFDSILSSEFSEQNMLELNVASNKEEDNFKVEQETDQYNNEDVDNNSTKCEIERPASPVIASSKKLKFLQKRSNDMRKVNLEKMINSQAPHNYQSLEQKNSLESTRQLFSDSLHKICKLDNSLSTISVATSISREVSPTNGSKVRSKDQKENPMVSNKSENHVGNSHEFSKIEKYARSMQKIKTGKVEKFKRNSLTAKYKKTMEGNGAKKNSEIVRKEFNEVENIPSIVENFLGDALGSEKDKYETTQADDSTFTNTNDLEFTDSNLFTSDETNKNLDNDCHPNLKQSFSNLSSSTKALLQIATTHIKKRKSSEHRRLSELQEELHVLLDSLTKQQLMIQQASKALKMCYTFKEFENSEEHVESERILLLAHLRKLAALEAIKSFPQKSKQPKDDNHGEITLEKIVVPLNNNSDKHEKNHRQNSKHDFVEWYMVVVQCGLTVMGSQPIRCSKSSTDIVVPGPFVLTKLAPDFKISFDVYRLKLKKKGDISHELKYHIRGNYSLADSWYKAISKLTSRSNQSKTNRMRLTRIFESSFMNVGHVKFTLKDLSTTEPRTLADADAVLKGTVDINFSYKVDLTESNMGFLTHGTDVKGYTVWNRRWCVLEGHILKFSDYPEEKPIMALDLIDCKDSEVGIVPRELCAKPRTIMLEFKCAKHCTDYGNVNDSNVEEQRNFLTLDTNRDLNEWLTKINRVLQALKKWNFKQ